MMSDNNERYFNGYRLIIVDCKEEKIIVDEMITALVGGCVTVVNSEPGFCAAKALGYTRCSPVGAQAAVEACEEAAQKVKENIVEKFSPGAVDKIKRMAGELAKELFGEEDET